MGLFKWMIPRPALAVCVPKQTDDPVPFRDRLEELPNIAQRPRRLHDAQEEACAFEKNQVFLTMLSMRVERILVFYRSTASHLCSARFASGRAVRARPSHPPTV